MRQTPLRLPLPASGSRPRARAEALSYLPAIDQCHARQTCKLFAVLVDEIARTTSFMTSVVGPMATAVTDLSPKLEAEPTMGILFTKDEEPPERLETLARQLPYHLELVGGDMSVVAGTDVSGALVQSNDMRRAPRCAVGEAALALGRFPEARGASSTTRARADVRAARGRGRAGRQVEGLSAGAAVPRGGGDRGAAAGRTPTRPSSAASPRAAPSPPPPGAFEDVDEG